MKISKICLPIDIALDLFDHMICPVLTYGCEIWGYENCTMLERLHLKFCKYILGLKPSTPSAMVYGELGRYPISITIKVRMVVFWYKLITGKKAKLSSRMYQILHNLFIQNKYASSWLVFVKSILDECGHIWYSYQTLSLNCKLEWLKRAVRRTLVDQFIQQWTEEMRRSSKCDVYREFKTELKFESYLTNLPKVSARYLCKYRTCNHRLPIETGRYLKLERNRRICNLCHNGDLGDEYHYLFVCKDQDLMHQRKQLLPKFYWKNPSMFKYITLMGEISSKKMLSRRVSAICKEIIINVKQ